MNEQDVGAIAQVAGWRKSSYSQGANDCVEVAQVPGWVGVRDSKLRTTSAMLVFGTAQWDALRGCLVSAAG